MSKQANDFPLPAEQKTSAGDYRRVGVEFEFTGISINTSSKVIRDLWGGQIEIDSDYENRVVDTEVGDIRVELDNSYLKNLGSERASGAWKPNDLERLTESIYAAAAKQVVPVEIVTGPIPLPDLHKLELLCDKLHEAGAEGTQDSLLYAFGIHFNPESPACDAPTLTAYIKAFLMLYDWLLAYLNVDVSRRFSSYVDPFPKDYHLLVTAEDYAPDLDQLIDDYLTHNPTRNRALDMLPMFAELDEPRLRKVIDDDRVKARPTFHYRLPNCRIGLPGWSLGHEWQSWLAVEQLANDPAALAKLAEQYQALLKHPVRNIMKNWADICSEQLDLPPIKK